MSDKKKRKTDNEATKVMSLEAFRDAEKEALRKSVKDKTEKPKKKKVKKDNEVTQNIPLEKVNEESKAVQSKTEKPKKKKSKSKKKKKSKFRFKIVLYIILIVIIGAILTIGMTLSKYIGMINREDTGTRNIVSLNPNLIYSGSVKNILIIGTDERENSEQGRSDTIILLSLDEYNQKMNMVSFMRDMYVDIPNHGKGKINSAYSYGGAGLLMDTIEENFGIKVDEYVSVNFNAFAGVVDAAGGIEIDVTDAEAQEINNILRNEVNELMGDEKESDFLNSGGLQRLNGKQALCYSRIRYVGDADFERTQRQRKVLSELISELKTINPFKFDSIMKETLPHITTNMSNVSLYGSAAKMVVYLGYDINQIRIPVDKSWGYSTIDGLSVITVDFNENILMLAKELYGIEYSED